MRYGIPYGMTPRPEARAALERKRAAFAAAVDRQYWRERRIVAGTASVETIEAALEFRHLSRVLAGPRSMMFKRRIEK